ncbi:hypothetical protein NDU88_000707 [Pleurodeles waltl]|uniref:Uncharacterized protein n=1 Tax=Pleurodeles waltl TaxID=8319 RepID=A0AAV7WKG9_PLEWA|nr:hypothetical protein NDU88_000707 [Pleurodeles waltl]
MKSCVYSAQLLRRSRSALYQMHEMRQPSRFPRSCELGTVSERGPDCKTRDVQPLTPITRGRPHFTNCVILRRPLCPCSLTGPKDWEPR